MKLNNFIKYVGGEGIIFEAKNGEKWLFYCGTGMKIPKGKNVTGTMFSMPECIENLLTDDQYEACTCTAAFLPSPDAKPSELMRKFRIPADDLYIDIPNKVFGFIEKSDGTFINEYYTDDDDHYTALLVTDDYGDDRGFQMIYIVKEERSKT